MRIAVFGATGRSGMPLVEQALERGHDVTVLARSKAKAADVLPSTRRLTVIEGDILDTVAVDKVVQGADAVVNVAGHVKGSPTDLQQRAISEVLTAMANHGVRRLVTLTGAGVRTDGDEPTPIDRAFRFALEKLQPALLADSEAYVARVRAGDTDWTVARAPRLTPGRTGSYRVARHVGKSTGTKLARGDLASFILDELEQGQYVGALPVVST